MVLREKLEEYDAELKEVESFDDNIIYRGVNSFTLRLLKRKRAFIEKRILTIQELSRDVQSCSLDSKCTFLLKSSSELEDLTEQVNQTLDEVFARGAVETDGNSVNSSASYEVWRDRTVSMPAMRWSIDDEAKDLEDAIWAAAEVAEKIEGAYVQVEKRYGSVQRTRKVETAVEALWTEAISGALKRQFPKLPNVSVTAEDVAQSENRPLEAAVGAIVSTAVATAFAGFAISLFGLSPSLDSILHWSAVVPRSLSEFTMVVAWTLPLAAAYGALGGMRRLDEVLSPKGPVGAVTSAAATAADRLQAGSRLLQYSKGCKQQDMRSLYLLSTIEMVGLYTPLTYGLLPAALLRLGGPSMGSWFFKGGFFAPSLLQVPLLTLSVALAVGTVEVLRSLGDSIDEDARRDSTQDIDWLVNVDEPLGIMRNGRYVVTDDLGDTTQAAEEGLRSRQLIPPGKPLSEVSEAPTSITLDWQTAAAQKSKRQLEEWIYPTAVTVVAAYLCLEAQITHELAYVAVTHFVSITVLDLMSRPWAHPNVMVRVEVAPPQKRQGAVIKVDKANQSNND